MAWMLRRGASLTPSLTMILGGLAAGGLAGDEPTHETSQLAGTGVIVHPLTAEDLE
jgi:hypothetical protein